MSEPGDGTPKSPTDPPSGDKPKQPEESPFRTAIRRADAGILSASNRLAKTRVYSATATLARRFPTYSAIGAAVIFLTCVGPRCDDAVPRLEGELRSLRADRDTIQGQFDAERGRAQRAVSEHSALRARVQQLEADAQALAASRSGGPTSPSPEDVERMKGEIAAQERARADERVEKIRAELAEEATERAKTVSGDAARTAREGVQREIADLEREVSRLRSLGAGGRIDDQFMRAADWFYDKLLDKSASEQERQFAAKTLRFAVRGAREDFSEIARAVEREFARALDFGRSELRLILTKGYVERARLYYQIAMNAKEKEEPREALDTILKAIFYDGNNWLYWAEAADIYLSTWEAKAIHSPEKAVLYGMMAVALNPREPFSYWGLSSGHLRLGKHADTIRVCSKALELAKFEAATYSGWQGDHGRAKFTALKGISLLEGGDQAGAREYLQTAFSLDENISWAREPLERALRPLREAATLIRLGEKQTLGLQMKREGNHLIVTRIDQGSPAAGADIREGDVIARIDGLPAVDGRGSDRLNATIHGIATGAQVSAVVELRRGEAVRYLRVEK